MMKAKQTDFNLRYALAEEECIHKVKKSTPAEVGTVLSKLKVPLPKGGQ